MGQLIEYETPLAEVRGVFLCENVAAPAPVSAVTGAIDQEDWGTDNADLGTGATNLDGDIYLEL